MCVGDIWTTGIAYVTYDTNNTPSAIYFTNGNETRYAYGASGRKLRVTHHVAKPNVTRAFGVRPVGSTQDEVLFAGQTDYLLGGSLVVRDGSIDKVLFDGGYAKGTRLGSTTYGFSPYYYNKDHLGNVREVVSMGGTVQQVTNYYPFGAPYADPNAVMGATVQPYKYNGKELDRMHGLDTYDYGARQYDPILARWDRVDPLCEKYYGVSPYVYCKGNPINYIDSIGMSYDWVQNQHSNRIEWRDDVTSPDNTPNGYSYIGKGGNDILHHFGFTSDVLSQKETLLAAGREGTPSANANQFKLINTTALLRLEAVTTIDISAKTKSNTSGLTFSGIKIYGSFTQDDFTSNPNYSFLYGGTLNAKIQGATTYSNLEFRKGPSFNIPGNVTKEASIFVSQELLSRGTMIQNVKIDVGFPSTIIVKPHSFKFNIYR